MCSCGNKLRFSKERLISVYLMLSELEFVNFLLRFTGSLKKLVVLGGLLGLFKTLDCRN